MGVREFWSGKKRALKRRDLTPIGASTTGRAARSRRGLGPSCGARPGAWLLSPRTSRWRDTWKQMKHVKNCTTLFTCCHPSKRSIEGSVCWRNNGVSHSSTSFFLMDWRVSEINTWECSSLPSFFLSTDAPGRKFFCTLAFFYLNRAGSTDSVSPLCAFALMMTIFKENEELLVV